MAATFLFTVDAVIAFLPVAVLLFLVLDKYAAPRVPKSLFDEKKVFLTFAVGIPLGIVLGVIFLAYASSLNVGDLGGSSLYALLFVLVAALLRRMLVYTKTFGGVGGSDPLIPVHVMAYGAVSGGTVALALGFDLFGSSSFPTVWTFLILAGTAGVMVIMEAWAGLRFGRAMRKGFSWIPPIAVVVGELVGLVALAPAFSGFPDAAAVTIPLFLVGGSWAMFQEEPKALRGLHRSRDAIQKENVGKFGRGGSGSAEGTLEGSPPSSEGAPKESPAEKSSDGA
jgi:hypothetical protein